MNIYANLKYPADWDIHLVLGRYPEGWVSVYQQHSGNVLYYRFGGKKQRWLTVNSSETPVAENQPNYVRQVNGEVYVDLPAALRFLGADGTAIPLIVPKRWKGYKLVLFAVSQCHDVSQWAVIYLQKGNKEYRLMAKRDGTELWVYDHEHLTLKPTPTKGIYVTPDVSGEYAYYFNIQRMLEDNLP